MTLVDYGWTVDLDGVFRAHAASGLVPGRVVKQSRDVSRVVTSEGEQLCEVSGRFRRTALGPSAFPAVGDWAALRPTPDGRYVIEALLPRTSAFSRKAPGNATGAQIVAANVDLVLLVSGLDRDFDVRRIERYVATAWSSGAQPVIVLNKCCGARSTRELPRSAPRDGLPRDSQGRDVTTPGGEDRRTRLRCPPRGAQKESPPPY